MFLRYKIFEITENDKGKHSVNVFVPYRFKVLPNVNFTMCLDLPQVDDLMNFRVEFVRPRSSRF